MSHELIARSTDLTRLKEERYSISITDDAYLKIDGVPYVTAGNTIACASLLMAMTLNGGVAGKPPDHVAYWTGELPHRANKSSLEDKIGGSSGSQIGSVGNVLMFSARADYKDYHHKVVTYVELLEREARQIQPGVTARRKDKNDS